MSASAKKPTAGKSMVKAKASSKPGTQVSKAKPATPTKSAALPTASRIPSHAQARAAEASQSPKHAQTTDEARLARNAALREYRAAHKSEVRAYMAAWREKREAKAMSDTASTSEPEPTTDEAARQ
jgi:hypothetical protein